MKSLIPHTGSALLIFLELSDLPLQLRESMTAAPDSRIGWDGWPCGIGMFPSHMPEMGSFFFFVSLDTPSTLISHHHTRTHI
jgi:hypothetical protein